MAKLCFKCSDAITGTDYVVCRGYCGATFHMNACSGVTRALHSYFATNKKNLFWMCDKCAELFENSHFRDITSKVDQTSPLNLLTTAITELRTEIKQMHSKPTVDVSPAADWPPLLQQTANERPHVTKVTTRASENCRVGKKQQLDDIVSVPICKNDNQQFWLYLSRIQPDVEIEAVASMIKSNLRIDSNPAIVKLIPKDKDISTLSFVSFKVGLDPSLKVMALNPETWPEGLLFREFQDYGYQKFRGSSTYRKPPSLLSARSFPAQEQV